MATAMMDTIPVKLLDCDTECHSLRKHIQDVQDIEWQLDKAGKGCKENDTVHLKKNTNTNTNTNNNSTCKFMRAATTKMTRVNNWSATKM
jgi:hypothetical protein